MLFNFIIPFPLHKVAQQQQRGHLQQRAHELNQQSRALKEFVPYQLLKELDISEVCSLSALKELDISEVLSKGTAGPTTRAALFHLQANDSVGHGCVLTPRYSHVTFQSCQEPPHKKADYTMTRHTWHVWHTPHNFRAASYQPVHSMLIPEMVQSINTGLPVITNLRTMKKKKILKVKFSSNKQGRTDS